MDPVSIIVTAIVAGAAEALKGTATQAVKDGYNGLKALLARKLGDKPNGDDISAAVQQVERKPEATSRQDVLREELTTASAEQDRELLEAAQALIELLGRASSINISATNSGSGAIAQGEGAVAAGQGGVAIGRDNSGNINTGEQVNTGGGTYVRGNVSTGRDFVGRDQTITNNYYGAASEDAAGQSISTEGRKLFTLLDGYFSLSDIEGLCFEMGIDDENLRGGTKADKARALIRHVEKNGQLEELKRLMRVARPNLRSQLA
jgi:hypothetical protein